jgi:hypothetical protein
VLGPLFVYIIPEETQRGVPFPSPLHWIFYAIFVSISLMLKFVFVYGFLPFRFQDFLAAWAVRVRPSVPWKLLACVWLLTLVVGTPGLTDNPFLATLLGLMIVRLPFFMLYRFVSPTIQRVFAQQQLLTSPKRACIFFFHSADFFLGIRCFSSLILNMLSTSLTNLFYTSFQPESQATCLMAALHFLVTVGFWGWLEPIFELKLGTGSYWCIYFLFCVVWGFFLAYQVENM